jgi:hypothetical protein
MKTFFMWTITVLLVSCKSTYLADRAPSRHSLQGHDLTDFVKKYNLWSDPGLHTRTDVKLAEKEFELEMRSIKELNNLLSPDCKITFKTDEQQRQMDRTEFINMLNRTRFMWKSKQTILNGPTYTLEREQALVNQLKKNDSPDEGATEIWDEVLTVRIFNQKPVITHINLTLSEKSGP